MSDVDNEYEESFDGEEKSNNLLSLTSDKFTRKIATVKIKDIGLSESSKLGRTSTIIGLSQSIAELGVLTPIHVMTVEQHNDDDDDTYKYMLLNGARRVYGAIKNNLTEVQAIVWDFEDKELGRKVSLALGLMLDRTQKRQWKEIWELYQILELQSAITPNTLEYLLQLDAGDAMKLKDCMLCDYSEVVEMLVNGTKTLEQSYKQLQKLRKEENKLLKEEETGISNSVEGAEDIVSHEVAPKLSDAEVSSILELESDDDVSNADLGEMDMSQDVNPAKAQKVGERHPLDPSLRKSVLNRDGKCMCCSIDSTLNIGVFTVHHLINVSQGGKDVLENLVTLCQNCHMLVHLYCMGEIHVDKSIYDAMSESEQIKLKNIMKYGNISIKAGKAIGMKAEDIRKISSDGARHHAMPNENLKANREALGNN